MFALLEDLYEVDELRYTFTIVYRLLFHYEDPQTVEYVLNDSSDNCTFFCSSEPTDILNLEGKPACCSRAFIPGVQAVNMISIKGKLFVAVIHGRLASGKDTVTSTGMKHESDSVTWADAGQESPADYQLSVLSNTTVAYTSRTRSSYSTDLQYAGYPFDK